MDISLRVALVDDHQMFREGIRGRLEQEADIEVVGESATAADAMEMIERTSPTIAVLDIRLPDMSGIELAKALKRSRPDLKILMLSAYDFDQYVRAAGRAGIQGYLLKDSPQDTLVEALREIAEGGAVLPPKIASKLMQTYAADPRSLPERRPDELTIREIDVLELMCQSLRNNEIASRLEISPRTVEVHVSNIIAKLGATSRTDAVRIASDEDLIR